MYVSILLPQVVYVWTLICVEDLSWRDGAVSLRRLPIETRGWSSSCCILCLDSAALDAQRIQQTDTTATDSPKMSETLLDCSAGTHGGLFDCVANPAVLVT
jgi:hypothetical protein